jgi:hypothetical protein
MSNQEALTREQLAREFQWALFPGTIKERLYHHYLMFTHDGNLQEAERDIQSASNTLEWLTKGARIDSCLNEHRSYFGQASTDDLIEIVQQLRDLQKQPANDQRLS